MNTQVTLFDQPQQLPAYLQTSEAAKALALQMEGGLAGQSINRISLRNGKFRFNKAGIEVGISRSPTLDVVIVSANPHVSRIFYAKAFDADAAGERPDCYSKDGRTPEADSTSRQSETCALCPQNAVNSSRTGKGKACAYKKRLVVTADGDISGDAYAIDVAAMGLFGGDDPAAKQFNLKSYIEALKANGLIVPSVVTQLSFDDAESVPKLFFKPVRILSAEEFAQVETRMVDPLVRAMLDDAQNATEASKPVGQAPAAIAAPAPAAVVPPATPAAAAKPRGRPKAADAPPVQAPAPTAAPAAPATGGFGFGAPAAAAVPATPAPAVTATTPVPAGGFSVDLDSFDD